MNRGQVIKLRLRRAGSGTFLHYESVRHYSCSCVSLTATLMWPTCMNSCYLHWVQVHRETIGQSDGAASARLHKTSTPGPHQQRSCIQVLGTMLHELCHNEHGPHNAAFYKLLDEIKAVRSASGRYGVRLVL